MKISRLAIALPTCLTLIGFPVAVVALSIRRRRKRRRGSNRNDAASKEKEEEDIISQLSDDILVSIIARLQTKFAVRTSILSKRWKNLYKFVPDIDLDHGPLCLNAIDQVDSFLRLRCGLKIRSLLLTCRMMKLHPNRYEQFFFSLGRLGVQRLNLHGYFHGVTCLYLSCHIISQMPSLEDFCLRACTLHRMPKCFDAGLCSLHRMPTLKLTHSNNTLQVLRLEKVTLLDGALECILANCLSLHSLSIVGCGSPSKLVFRGPNLRLKSLWMFANTGVKNIEFYAGDLVTFEFDSFEVVQFIFDHVPKLQYIFINVRNINTMSWVCTELLKDLPGLESLIATTRGVYQVTAADIGINTFDNLRRLSLSLDQGQRVNLFLLAPFLQRCPLLQEFHLDTEFLESDPEVNRPATAIHTELKRVELTGFSGTKMEVEFALYILRSAMSLEQMQITRCSKCYHGFERWVGRNNMKAWSKETLKMIHNQFRGQALSENARVTIHLPFYAW